MDGRMDGRMDRWMDGWIDRQTERRMENLPILQDFVPYRGRCPATAQLQPENYIKQGKGTADHKMPLGAWLKLWATVWYLIQTFLAVGSPEIVLQSNKTQKRQNSQTSQNSHDYPKTAEKGWKWMGMDWNGWKWQKNAIMAKTAKTAKIAKNSQKRLKTAEKDPESCKPQISMTPNLNNPESQRPRFSTTANLDDRESRRPQISTTPNFDDPKSQRPQNSTTLNLDNPKSQQSPH